MKNKFELFPILFREENRINAYFSYGWEKSIREYCKANRIEYTNSTTSKEVDIVLLVQKLELYLGVKLITKEEKSALLQLIAEAFGFDSLNPKLTTCNSSLSDAGIPFYIDDGNTTREGKKVRYYIVLHEDDISGEK